MDYLQHIDSIIENRDAILDRLTTLKRSCDQDFSLPELIAVSKKQPEARIDAALHMGQRHFGENQVQEAITHWQARKSVYDDVVLHLIGPLQSNKTADAVALFDVIHSVDRLKIARAIHEECAKQHRQIACFIQINTGAEEQKSGILPDAADDFIRQCIDEVGLNIVGLMCIPPAGLNPAPHFALLKTIADRHGLKELSMGMSDDYHLAARLGATYIRVGTSFFGERVLNS